MRPILLFFVLLLWIVPLHAQDDPSPYDIALQRIQEAADSGATELDLRLLRLTTLPPEIGELTNLRILRLSRNKLTELPPEIGQLTNLRLLWLSYNYLTELPLEIGQLTNLEALMLGSNQVGSLPSEIGQLAKLEVLSLWSNRLEALPPEIGQLSNLITLELYGNQLKALPPEISQLHSLCYLDIRANQIASLPVTMGRMTSLLYSRQSCDDTSNPDYGLFSDFTPHISLLSSPEEVEQGTEAILAYLRNQAWHHTQRWIIGIAAGVGLLVLFMLGFRFKQRSSRKRKPAM